MTLVVHTARLFSPAARASADLLDVTRKSGCELGKVFAPSWAIMRPMLDARAGAREHRKAAKRKGATPDFVAARLAAAERYDQEVDSAWPAYVEAYTEEMRQSYRRQREAWERLLAAPTRTLACYCTDAARCHRTLLASMLVKLGARSMGEV